jgi:hypothetical protein
MANSDDSDVSETPNFLIQLFNYGKVLLICTLIMYVILTFAVLPILGLVNTISIPQMFVWGFALMVVKFNPSAIHLNRISFHTFETQRLMELMLKNLLSTNRLIQDVNHTIKTKE